MSFIDVSQQGSSIFAWCRNMDGELEIFEEKARDYTYLFVPDNSTNTTGGYTSIFGTPMRKRHFRNRKELQDFAMTADSPHESDVKPIYKFLLENFLDTETEAPVNIGYYDIEVDYDLRKGDGFPSVENPYGEINAISLLDSYNKKIVMFVLTGLEEIKYPEVEVPIETRFFVSERKLLHAFSEYIDHIDILTGWNCKEFDLPYIMTRSERLFGKRAKSMYCRNGFEATKVDYNNDFGQDVHRWDLVGRVHIDMMEVYKKFIPKEGSKALNAVCERELGMTKIAYKGDLGDLYRTNPNEFFVYSMQDSRLLYLLDKKLDLIPLAVLLSRDSCALLNDVLGTVKTIEQGFLKFCRKKNNLVVPDRKNKEKEEFAGAVVYNTVAGLHKKMFTIDLTALYPSIMRILGLSAETTVGQLLGEENDYYRTITDADELVQFQTEDGEIHELKGYEMHQIIKESGYTISAYGTVFNGKMGILSEFTEYLFLTRKQFKGMMKKAETKEEQKKYNLYQMVYKIYGNSVYGCVSNNYFVLFDIRHARSITYTGKIISKFMNYRTNQTLREVLNG